MMKSYNKGFLIVVRNVWESMTWSCLQIRQFCISLRSFLFCVSFVNDAFFFVVQLTPLSEPIN